MPNPAWRWYITIAAVREWMRITERTGPLEEDNPAFLAAQNELGDLSQIAHLTGKRPRYEGQEIWECKVTHPQSGHRIRVEFSVATAPRAEGTLPQLVWVATRGRNNRGRAGL